jgi:hypothetical protein
MEPTIVPILPSTPVFLGGGGGGILLVPFRFALSSGKNSEGLTVSEGGLTTDSGIVVSS